MYHARGMLNTKISEMFHVVINDKGVILPFQIRTADWDNCYCEPMVTYKKYVSDLTGLLVLRYGKKEIAVRLYTISESTMYTGMFPVHKTPDGISAPSMRGMPNTSRDINKLSGCII